MKLEDKAFAEHFDLLKCIQCGKCTGGCPVSLKSRLNVRRLVNDAILREDPAFLMEKEELWECTSCGACTVKCPKQAKPSQVVFGMRSILVERAKVPVAVRDALESVVKHGNPWNKLREKRTDWCKDLGLKSVGEGAQVDYLYYVCCTAAYDPRIQKTALALVKLLNKAGVNFGTLGDQESCCGNDAFRMGERGLFEMLVEDNSALLKDTGVKTILTASPHCFNALKNEYAGLGLEVVHYTQLLARLVREGRLALQGGSGVPPAKPEDGSTASSASSGAPPAATPAKRVVAYHDPCFLGRQNKVFDEPRELIKAVPGVEFVELDRARERSLCCEGGGGRMWIESTSKKERLAETRVKDALSKNANILATACPFCVLTLEDAVKTTGSEEKIRIVDVAELLAEHL
ncbi:MAG: (Fe-S)-binding protein [Planctomycetota bacterium]|nr:(Fe-S)-binding protein [Planctomycetota bacterium]